MNKFEFLGKLYNSLEEAEKKLNEWCELTNTKIEHTWVHNGIHSYDYVIKESWGVKCNSILIKEHEENKHHHRSLEEIEKMVAILGLKENR